MIGKRGWDEKKKKKISYPPLLICRRLSPGWRDARTILYYDAQSFRGSCNARAKSGGACSDVSSKVVWGAVLSIWRCGAPFIPAKSRQYAHQGPAEIFDSYKYVCECCDTLSENIIYTQGWTILGYIHRVMAQTCQSQCDLFYTPPTHEGPMSLYPLAVWKLRSLLAKLQGRTVNT